MSEAIVFTYKPRDGLFVAGVPARDLTQGDVNTAGATLMRTAVDTGLYVPVKPKPETKKEKEAREKAEAEAEAARLAAEKDAPPPDGGAPSGDDGDDDSGDAGEGEKS